MRAQGLGPVSVVASLGRYLPERVVVSEWIEDRLGLQKRFGIPYGIIEKLTGVRERRYAAEGDTSSDLAARAAHVALERAGMTAADIDTIIFAAASHDIAEPATANLLQDKLAARNAHVFDVKNACNSFLNALDLADALIRLRRAETVLIAVGEVLSPTVNWRLETLEQLELGFAALTLGDGGAAMVLCASDRLDEPRGLLTRRFYSDGSAWDLATIKFGGTLCPRDLSQSYFESRSTELQQLALECMPPVIRQALRDVGWSWEDVDLVVPHQVSLRIMQKMSRVLELPLEKCMITLPQYGNTAAASIPIALCEAVEVGQVKPNSRLLLIGGASGFSVGVLARVL
jgi:3-oxoacyl-(acyl-carrier-protein) synthase III